MTVSRRLIIKKRKPRFPVIPHFDDGIIGGFKLTEQNWYKVLVEWLKNLVNKKYDLQRFFFSKILHYDDDYDDSDDDDIYQIPSKLIKNSVDNKLDGMGKIENREIKKLQKELLRILSIYKNPVRGGAILVKNATNPNQQVIAPVEEVKESTGKKLQNFFKKLAIMLKKGGKSAVVAANFIMQLISIFSETESDTKNKKNTQLQPRLHGSGQTAGTRGTFQTLQGLLEMGGAAAVTALSWINKNILGHAPTPANNAKLAGNIAAAGGVTAYLTKRTGNVNLETPLPTTPVTPVFTDDTNTTMNRTVSQPPFPPGSSSHPGGFRRPPPPPSVEVGPGLPPDYGPDYGPDGIPWYDVSGTNITFLNEALRYISRTVYVTRETLTILRIIINDLYLDPRPEHLRSTPITNTERRNYLVRDLKRYTAQTGYKQLIYRITDKLILLALWGLGSITGINFLLISTSMPFLISLLTSLSVSVVASIADKIDIQSKIGIGFDMLVRIVHIIMDKLSDILRNKKRRIDAEIAPSTAIMQTIPVPASTSAPSTANIVSEVTTSDDAPVIQREIRNFQRGSIGAPRVETDEEHLRNVLGEMNSVFDFTKQKKSNAKKRRGASSKK